MIDAETGQVDGGGVCKDSQGRTYETGHLFIPEPCTVCICDNGNPKWCKEVICTLPQVKEYYFSSRIHSRLLRIVPMPTPLYRIR